MEALSRSIAMRKLKGKDLEILKKLVPEVEEKLRSGSGIEYHSILPPVSMHYAVDEEDFEERLKRLSGEDLTYLVDRILDESECLLCISTEYAKIFVDVLAEKVSKETSERIKEMYESATGYKL
jgi:hypothetical protein